MCINSGSSSGSTDGVVGLNGGLSRNSKKPQKRQRLPKRGPGVAKLEKILRERESKNDHHIMEAFNPSCFVPHPPLSSNNNDPFHNFPQTLNSRPPQPPPPIPMTPTMNILCGSNSLTCRRLVNLGQQYLDHQTAPASPNIYANGNTSFIQRPNIVGGSDVASLDQKAFFPVTWSSSTTPSMSNNVIGNADEGKYSDSSSIILSLPKPFSDESNPLLSSPSLMQNKHPQNPNSMINQFRGSASSSSAPSSAGLYNPVEPPSSQRSYHSYPSMGQEEEACVIGMRRPSQSFPMDNPPGPPIFHHQVPQFLPHMHRPTDQLSSYNLDLSETMPPTRDSKLDKSLELNVHNYTIQYGAPNAISFKFVPQTVVLPPHHTFQDHQVSKFDMLPLQGSMEEYSNRRLEAAGSDLNKPFYKFLLSKEQVGKENIHNVDNESESGEEGIDLNLKL
ncbi:uncharacterized protein LOC112489269 isoform X2 [Ziziphus jujuba]|uniref:Uncharacterized protein LOC112489269 isoform X2 n=1 Tax=Ziziphus jujuba TaxID=326968 RepID=A0ABM3I4S0_ZIZJJ|nr:uncharacterized protein LOC112489269 isoform X2 [Ziziphus jujuba]